MATAPSSRAPQAPAARLTRAVRTWKDVTIHPDPNATLTFQLGRTTIGRLQNGDRLDVPLPAPIRAVVLEHGLAVAADGSTLSDAVAHPLQTPDDVAPATQLLRLSYLYRRLLRTRDATTLHRIRIELSQREVPEALRTVYDAMLAKRDAARSS